MVEKILNVLFLDHIYDLRPRKFRKEKVQLLVSQLVRSILGWKWAKNQHSGYLVPRRRWKGIQKLILCTFFNPIVFLLHSVCFTGEPRQLCRLAPEHDVFGHNPFQYILIGRCSCPLFLLGRPNVLDEYLTSEVSWRRPVMSLLAISPFLPILSTPCFSHCFAALRLLSLLDIKRKTIQRHLMSDTIYVSLSVRCTICFDVSSDVWSAHISFHQTFAPSPNNWLLNVWLQQRIHNWLLLAANSCKCAMFCWLNTWAIGAEHRLTHYQVLLELLEQLAYYQLLTSGADLLWSRWGADGTLWSGVHWYSAFSRVPQHQLIVVFNIGRCALCVCGPWSASICSLL